MGYLDEKHNLRDLQNLNEKELTALAAEIRDFMVENVAATGGHLAPSLGTVELIIALCRAFDFPRDRVIFDVGHQSYAYKILTGRKEVFHTLRQEGGISGFPKSEESDYDAFDTGHSSTSISAALGLAVARDIKGENYHVISVIGDGALTGGMAYEAMNNAGSREEDLIVILNDNQMSISKNVGAMANYLAKVRTAPNYSRRKQYIKRLLRKTSGGTKVLSGLRRVRDSIKHLMVQGMFFEEMGFTYLGPIDGHDIEGIERHLGYCKNVKGPVLLHVLTKKGKGYSFAEKEPDKFHGIGPFKKETGEVTAEKTLGFSGIFGAKLKELVAMDYRLTAVTAAMPDGTGLISFAKAYPDHFFDVGIAEPHALTYAAGLAKNGLKPCVAIYSSFLQRAVDQVYHDICLQNLPVVIAIDRAGVVGEDGETHQGIYDIALLRSFPGLVFMAPGTGKELEEMLVYAFSLNCPCALRYPKGSVGQWDQDYVHQPLAQGKGELVKAGEKVLLIPLGIMTEDCIKAGKLLEPLGIKAGIYNSRFIKPLSVADFQELAAVYDTFITVEDHALCGGFGSAVTELIQKNALAVKVHCLGLPDEPIRQGKRSKILEKYGLDAKGIAAFVERTIKE